MMLFKAGLKIIRGNFLTLIIYICAFIMLAVLMSQYSTQTGNAVFSEIRFTFALVNRDGDSALISGLEKYLSEHGEEISLKDDKQVLQDAVFFEGVDCIIVVPSGFSDQFKSIDDPEMMMETTFRPSSQRAYLVSGLLEQYLHVFRTYQESVPDLTEEEIADMVTKNLSVEGKVELKESVISGAVGRGLTQYFSMFGYILNVLVIFIVSTIMMTLQKPDLRMRNLSSPMGVRSQNFQMVLCTFLFSLFAWMLLVFMGFFIYQDDLQLGLPLLLMLLNSFVFLIVSTSVAFFVGLFARSSSAQNAAANIISLSFSFLGGILVPVEILGANVLNFSRFIPTYWYGIVLDEIYAAVDFQDKSMTLIRNGMMIQLGFAAAIFMVGFAVSRTRQQSSSGFGTIRTVRG